MEMIGILNHPGQETSITEERNEELENRTPGL